MISQINRKMARGRLGWDKIKRGKERTIISLPLHQSFKYYLSGGFIEGFIVVAALGALDAGGAAVLAGALGNNVEGGPP